MLKKILTGADILEMIKKQLAADGLVFKGITDNSDFDFSNLARIEVEVGVKRDPVSEGVLVYPPGVRTPALGMPK